MPRVEQTELFENAQIIFRNFEGKEGQYNAAGDRNFCVVMDEARAQRMASVGWNVKQLKPREEGDTPLYYIQVSVGFGRGRPPRMVVISSAGRADLGEDQAILLDWVDIAKVDLIIRPYNWEVGGRSGVKAYLKSIFVTILEDELELKYRDVPRAAELPSGQEAPRALTTGLDPDMSDFDENDMDIVDAEVVE